MKNIIKPIILSFAILFTVQSPVYAASCSDAIQLERLARQEHNRLVKEGADFIDILNAAGVLAAAILDRRLACESTVIGIN